MTNRKYSYEEKKLNRFRKKPLKKIVVANLYSFVRLNLGETIRQRLLLSKGLFTLQ